MKVGAFMAAMKLGAVVIFHAHPGIFSIFLLVLRHHNGTRKGSQHSNIHFKYILCRQKKENNKKRKVDI
jgi:hypothetical protein